MAPPATNLEWPAKKVRETFINFFVDKGHPCLKSRPIVPDNDATFLFANAGMRQVKPIFMGSLDPKTELRACHTQKCIRIGYDFDDVGKDTYHHTFFEILGNWSIGDYFKTEAIQWAWELLTQASSCSLLTQVYKLPAGRIYVTCFGGDEKFGLPPDSEARDIWLKFLPENRVLNCKFNRETNGSLKPLPEKHVDTGMSFETLTSILQDQKSNYDTDIFMPIFDAIKKETRAHRYSGKVGAADRDKIDMAYRVVADHIRTLSFAIADGSCLGDEGHQYVLRRILRRAVRYDTDVLKVKKGFLDRLVQIVLNVNGDVFPELIEHETRIRDIISDEEFSFSSLRTVYLYEETDSSPEEVNCLSDTLATITASYLTGETTLFIFLLSTGSRRCQTTWAAPAYLAVFGLAYWCVMAMMS